MKRLVLLVGASGSGKTAVTKLLAERNRWSGRTHFFDSIGVPTPDEMVESYGSGEAWQKWATEEWVSRMAERDESLQLLEGQTRPSFIQDALRSHEGLEALIILLDCRSDVRRYRLTALRERPELATERMDNWAAYLAGRAEALGLPVVDTTHLSLDEVAVQVERACRCDVVSLRVASIGRGNE